MNLEFSILSNLAFNEEYGRKVQPFLKEEYFDNKLHRTLYSVINDFIVKYGSFPSKEAILIDLDNKKSGLSDEQHTEIVKLTNTLAIENTDIRWLLNTTEEWTKERAVYNGIMESVGIIEGKIKTKLDRGAIPDILTRALAVSFDTKVGSNYIEDAAERWDILHRPQEKIAFDLEYFNKITRGGVTKKTLNIIMGGTNVGKTLAFCHMAATNLLQGKKVLYITLEMAQEQIQNRIDANLLNIKLDDLENLSKDVFLENIERLKKKVPNRGLLIVKEYPTAQAGANHFRQLINELRIKKDFEPDVIYIDYLNICCSSRLKKSELSNSYNYVKAIAEELRGLAVEMNAAIWSGTQLNRSGMGDSDPELDSTSESIGLPFTADFMVVIVQNEEMEKMNQYMVKQLKNRYNNKTDNKRFCIGVDTNKMRLYDVEQEATDELTGNEPAQKEENNFGGFK